MKRIVIILAVVALMGTAIGAVFASAAGINISPVPPALGSGSEAVSSPGSITDVAWVLKVGDPTTLAKVTLTIDTQQPGSTSVDIRVKAAGSFDTFSVTAAAGWDAASCAPTCVETFDLTDLPAADVDTLDIVINQP